jgi:tRNA A37 threonylcarbamoyladenosine modification protein TsaB
MVLVIDTSSARSALALVENGHAVAEDVVAASREQDLPRRLAALTDPARLTGVGVSMGPGSFTGLRAGVSFGLGLAMGLRVLLWGLDPLLLQAARSPEPATALVEAGRGRIFWLEPGAAAPRHGEPAQLPRELPAIGWLRPATADAVRAAGVRLLGDEEATPFAEAAATQLQQARKLGYGTVSLRYMESFAPLRGQSW